MTPIFVCGVARSGTTLLTNLFDAHPQLAVFPGETYFYRTILDRNAGSVLLAASEHLASPGAAFRLARLTWRVLIAPDTADMSERLRLWSRSFPSCAKAFRDTERQAVLQNATLPRGYWDCYLALYERLSRLPVDNALQFVEKTPSNERYVAFMDAEFGQSARYVHIVRDPRDVVASWIHRMQLGPHERRRQMLRICHLWAVSVFLAAANEDRCRGRYALLRYEDLVRDPARQMAGLAAFLGIANDPCLLQPTRHRVSEPINTSYADDVETRGIADTHIGKHCELLSAGEIGAVEALLARQMTACGYHLSKANESPSAGGDEAVHGNPKQRLADCFRRHYIRSLQKRTSEPPFSIETR